MPLSAGTKLGAYEISSSLGAGGMGEVYRAHDAKLGRDVALKILPDAFAADPDRLGRFRREAQVLASLNHPNIAQIYGFEDSGATHALVMELVEGQTLEDLLGSPARALSLDEAIPIARQIADALEAAHDAGIVHRDLKPANIRIRRDGTVKVLDFGLAKALEGPVGPLNPTDSPTMTSPAMTRHGIILGTAGYMSPEQAKGRAVDKRADIWAFGVVLAEMLTGQRLFDGETVSETIAAVIKDEPRLDRLPAATPANVRHVLERCLERDPKTRLRDIGEARILLSRADAAVTSPPSVRSSRRTVWLVAAAGVLLAAAAGALAWRLKASAPVPVRRLNLPAAIAASSEAALAPDGSAIAYLSRSHVYVQALDALDPRDLGEMPPTAEQLFWSPDGQTIGFAAQGTMRSVPANGGPPFVIATIPATGRIMGAAWLANGTIVFSVWRDSLYRVPATGGTPSVYLAANPATEIDFHSISRLPDGRVVIETHRRQTDAAWTEITDGKRRVVLTTDPSTGDFKITPSGLMLFLRSGANRGLWAAPFTEGPIDLTKAVLVQAGVDAYDAANDGTLLYRIPAPLKSSLVWVDRAGTISAAPGAPLELANHDLALSPDGRRVVIIAGTRETPNLVVRDLVSGIDRPLTSNRTTNTVTWDEMRAPIWFPSGDRIAYTAGGVEAMRIFERRLDGSTDERALTAGRLPRVSRDGRTLLFLLEDRGKGRLRQATLQPDGSLGPSLPVFQGDEPNVNWADFSADGTALAVAVTETDGQSNIFLTRFPGGQGRWAVTTDGGTRPRFSADGRELFYLRGTRDPQGQRRGQLMSVPVTLHPSITLGAATPLFTLADQNAFLGPIGYDVTADGRRFLMSAPTPPTAREVARAVLVQNWAGAIRR